MDADVGLASYRRARELYERVDRLHPLDSNAFRSGLDARIYGSEILIEKGRGFEAFAEVAQVLQAAEAHRKADAAAR